VDLLWWPGKREVNSQVRPDKVNVHPQQLVEKLLSSRFVCICGRKRAEWYSHPGPALLYSLLKPELSGQARAVQSLITGNLQKQSFSIHPEAGHATIHLLLDVVGKLKKV
jgi:hypothetical protein